MVEVEDIRGLEGSAVDGCDIDLGGENDNNLPTIDSSQEDKEPKIGMEFDSEQSARKFYVNYGGTRGFKVRKNHHLKNKEGFVTRMTFCCSKEGYRKNDKRRENASYRHPISRVGCNAHMTCRLQQNGKYKIVSFVEEHNHELIRTPMKHMLRINRGMSKAQKTHADDADKAGIPIKATVELMGREIGGRENEERYGHLCRNFREIASCAAEHEKLAAVAHQRSVELLQELEEMKKKLFSENTNQNSQAPETTFGGSEAIETTTPLDNSLTIIPHGVKRKATVGRPRGQIKDPLE